MGTAHSQAHSVFFDLWLLINAANSLVNWQASDGLRLHQRAAEAEAKSARLTQIAPPVAKHGKNQQLTVKSGITMLWNKNENKQSPVFASIGLSSVSLALTQMLCELICAKIKSQKNRK
jgi:hypothetical protein